MTTVVPRPDPRQLRPPLSDVLLAAALVVANVVHVLLTPSVDRSRTVLLALSVLSAAPVAWRRTAPLASGIVVSLFLILLLAGDFPKFLTGAVAVVVISSYSAGAYIRSTAVAAIPLALILTAGWIDDIREHNPAGQYLATLALIGTPWALARIMRRQREQAERLETLTIELEDQRDRAARAAVAEERTRIARELHDVVAHAISVISVQSAGAESALAADPERAREPLRLIQRSSRDALLEMRRMLQVLRGSSPSTLDPQRGIADLPLLVEEVASAGTSVRLDLLGEREVSRALDINVYRIVQECLTNVRKHAGPGASATVRVERGSARLRIEVRDDGTGRDRNGDPGHGLVGIRERVRMFGGTMSAGDVAEGGFEVDVRIPTT